MGGGGGGGAVPVATIQLLETIISSRIVEQISYPGSWCRQWSRLEAHHQAFSCQYGQGDLCQTEFHHTSPPRAMTPARAGPAKARNATPPLTISVIDTRSG